MAGIMLRAVFGEVALAAATEKAVVQIIAPTNQRLKVKGWGVFFDGISGTEAPVVVKLVRTSTAGTFTSLTPVKLDPGVGETIQSTAGHTATAEPTSGDVLAMVEVHPQGGYEVIYPERDEIVVAGAGRLAVKCTAPAVVNVAGYITYEE